MRGTSLRRIEMLVLVLGCLGLLAAGPVRGAVGASLSPEAEQAYNQGLIAADQQAWEVAITSFAEAQKLAPRDPRILYSLGLAHAKAGHDLAGAAWLRAYLALSPRAPNALAVRTEVDRLLRATRSAMLRILATAVGAARTIPWEDARWSRLLALAWGEARVGEIEAALALEPEIGRLAAAIPKERPTPPSGHPIEVRDRAAVQAILWRTYLYYLVDTRDLPKAREVLARVTGDNQRVLALVALALGLAWDDKAKEGVKLLAEAESLTGKIVDPGLRALRLADLADAHQACNSERAKVMLERATAFAKEHQVTLPEKVEREVNPYAYDSYDYDDEATFRIRWAAMISSSPKVIDLAGELDRAVEHPERTAWTNGAADEQAVALGAVALTLGDFLALFRGWEARNWAENFERGKALVSLAVGDTIWPRIGKTALGDGIGIDHLRKLLDAKGPAWRASEKGQAVRQVIAVTDAISLYAEPVLDDNGWAIVLHIKKPDPPVYVTRERYPDLEQLQAALKGPLGDELLQWIVTDPASPLSGPIRAAKAAIQGESLR